MLRRTSPFSAARLREEAGYERRRHDVVTVGRDASFATSMSERSEARYVVERRREGDACRHGHDTPRTRHQIANLTSSRSEVADDIARVGLWDRRFDDRGRLEE